MATSIEPLIVMRNEMEAYIKALPMGHVSPHTVDLSKADALEAEAFLLRETNLQKKKAIGCTSRTAKRIG